MSRSTAPRPNLFADQARCSEEEYLALETNRLIEFTDGIIEVLPMPTTSHQRIVAYVYALISTLVEARRLGTVLFAPLRIRLREGKVREPDILFASADHADLIGEQYWTGADLVMEVVSDDAKSHERDYVTKREDYAAAGVAEYWIIDPKARLITVLRLTGNAYAVHGEYRAGSTAESALLRGFTVGVDEVLRLLPQKP